MAERGKAIGSGDSKKAMTRSNKAGLQFPEGRLPVFPSEGRRPRQDHRKSLQRCLRRFLSSSGRLGRAAAQALKQRRAGPLLRQRALLEPRQPLWIRPQEYAEEKRLGSPTLEDSRNAAGARQPASNGSLSADFYSGDEIEEVDDGGASPDDWSRGKEHLDEDDASVSWRKWKKHFFVLSHFGKPIYSTGFSATLQAIISFVENSGDRVKLVSAGNHQVVFLIMGPIYLVCISYTKESYGALRGQLELIYGQMLLILTTSVNRCFEKNPKFDMTTLLGGTDAVFSSLIHSFSWNPPFPSWVGMKKKKKEK